MAPSVREGLMIISPVSAVLFTALSFLFSDLFPIIKARVEQTERINAISADMIMFCYCN